VGDVVNFGDEEAFGNAQLPERAVRELRISDVAARERARDREFDFEKSVRSQIAMLRELCYGMNLQVTVEGRILNLPYYMWIDDLEKRMLDGMAALSFDEDPELGKVARVIPLKRSARPKKPKPSAKTPAMRVRVEPTPEALEARRLKREEAKARRKAERAARLAYIEERYGKDQAEAFAALSGWR
jgi:hypothetical protein